MTVFTRDVPDHRIAATEYGDTLQSVAGRELGDANRWYELAWINNLVHPYITDDPRRASAGVLLSGAFIKIPAPQRAYSGSDETGQVFERDVELRGRSLQVDEKGDFLVLSGSKNLAQQLTHRIVTPRGQATRHPRYGSLIYRLIGKLAAPTANFMAAQYAYSTVLADYRIKSISLAQAVVVGDAVKVEVRAMTIAGGPIDIKTE